MDVPKVPPRTAVQQLRQILDSPEVGALIQTLEYIRWTGRKGYPLRAMVGVMLAKTLYGMTTWTRILRLVAEHTDLQAAIGALPSQWACYRFARQLRTRDEWALTTCMERVIAALKAQHPDMGKTVAVDASDIPAFANGQGVSTGNRVPSDPDASWGHRSAASTHAKGSFYGYKVHAAVDVATGLPVAWTVATAKDPERNHAIALIDAARRHGLDVTTAIMDKGYDAAAIHDQCHARGIAPIIPIRALAEGRTDWREPPHCAHGAWTFAGADYKRKATKWRCPTGECEPKSMWLMANRYHPLVPRDTQRFKDLYRQRSAVEREFGNLKHEWALLPLRVRGIARVKLHADLTILAKLTCALAVHAIT